MNTILFMLAQAATTDPSQKTDPWMTLFINLVLPFLLIFGLVFFLARRPNARVKKSLENQEEAIRLAKEHYARTEALLERIAKAVEKNEFSN